MDIATILSLISFAIQEEPKVEQAIRNVLTKPNPTPADWQAERDAWASDTYEKLVPDSQLKAKVDPAPPVQPPTQSP